jgi:hypothetical protein
MLPQFIDAPWGADARARFERVAVELGGMQLLWGYRDADAAAGALKRADFVTLPGEYCRRQEGLLSVHDGPMLGDVEVALFDWASDAPYGPLLFCELFAEFSEPLTLPRHDPRVLYNLLRDCESGDICSLALYPGGDEILVAGAKATVPLDGLTPSLLCRLFGKVLGAAEAAPDLFSGKLGFDFWALESGGA